jgi:hypothetical protein
MSESGKFKWPVSVTRQIPATAEEVWRLISDSGNLTLYHPFCRENPVEKWPGAGSRDGVKYYNGMVLWRDFTNWIDGVGYDLFIGKKGGPTSRVTWRISPSGDGHCSLTITIEPYWLQNLPVFIRWLPYLLRLRPLLTSYLESVLKGFEYYITTGQKVKRNQFGAHPFFSPKVK